ncbi:sensor histidine kinase [Enterococcus timonensis]|uniref:sensor histidine kinase n=1 Tax=Enterococcus timonensis TaxID=1852364 RepID=UPI0008D940E5|nr:HAMP domain-containing sensor histidine kinase [Enterococcus timonensis]
MKRTDEKKRRQQDSEIKSRIVLTSKEVSELLAEALVTIVLLLLLNVALFMILDQVVASNQDLSDTIFNIKGLLSTQWDSDVFMSGKKFLVIILAIIDLIVLYWRLIRRYHQMQLRHVISELHFIAAGHYDHRIPFELSGDLGRVIDSINGLVESTVTAIDEERKIEQSKDELITNVSHDLRTPLTSIIGYLGLIEDKQYHSEEEFLHYTHTAYLKAKQMKVLVEDLFEYTKVRQPTTKINLMRVDLNQMMEQLAADFALEADKKGIAIEVSTTPMPFYIEADTEKLVRVFNNLLSNALKYGKGATVIEMDAQQVGTEAIITVRNNGQPIPQASLQQLFDRFYRVEESRSQETGGTGLGLAIAQSIVALHGGYIFAKSDKNWTKFIIHLPLGS